MQHGRGGDAENRRGGDTGMGGEPLAKGDHSQNRVRHRQGQGEGRPRADEVSLGLGPSDRFFGVKRKNGRFVWQLRKNSITLQPQIETV